jgi:hypothetical protein
MHIKRQSKKIRHIKKKINKKTNKTNKTVKPKRANKSMKSKRYRKGGMSGIQPIEGYTEEEAFNNFIDHSRITFLTKGANGVTFVAELPPNYIRLSPYISTDAATYGERVKYLIIKFAFLYNPDNNMYWKEDKKDPRKQILDDDKLNVQFDGLDNLALGLEEDLDREIEIQKDIYLKTMDYLEPICPAVVYSKIEKDPSQINRILNKLKTSARIDSQASQILNSFIQKRGDYDYIGIIGMEYAGGYETLHNLMYFPSVTRDNKKLYREMSMYLLLELADKAGYTHGDFHGGNLMINPSLRGYFKGIQGKPLLIDFGYAKKIEDPILSEIKGLCANRNYVTALQKICSVNRSDDLAIKDFPSYYGWACGYVDPNMNKEQIDAEIHGKTKAKIYNYQSLTGKSTVNTREINQISKSVLEEMANPANSRFPTNTNASLDRLFQQRKQATDELVVSFKREYPYGPDLPLSPETKQEIISSPGSEMHSLSVSPTSSSMSSPVSLVSSSIPSTPENPYAKIPFGSPEF